MKLGEENTFYFNEELQMWVERGKEDEYAKKKQGPPPPPTDKQLNQNQKKKGETTTLPNLTAQIPLPIRAITAQVIPIHLHHIRAQNPMRLNPRKNINDVNTKNTERAPRKRSRKRRRKLRLLLPP